MNPINQSSMIVIENLPIDIDIDELRSFLSIYDIKILRNGGIRIIPSNVDKIDSNDKSQTSSCDLQQPTTKMNAYICVENDRNVSIAVAKLNGTIFRDEHRLSVKRTTKKSMEKELRSNISAYIRKNLQMKCEWIDCNQIFNDRSLYLQHINETHVTYDYLSQLDNENNANFECKWFGCNSDDSIFANVGHFRLHLSLHAFHNQLMNIGRQIMNITVPKLVCYLDNPERNVLSETSKEFICGWNNCNAEFIDAETFFQHVDYHAIEDVQIPMISKEKLKKIRFARCEWINCQASFKKKSHLKMHLHSHTQRKLAACPVCGELFSTRIAFINHCYRQETPTFLTEEQSTTSTATAVVSINQSSILNNNNNDDDDDNDDALTIDENVSMNKSSIMIHQLSQKLNNSNIETVNQSIVNVNISNPSNQNDATNDHMSQIQIESSSTATGVLTNNSNDQIDYQREYQCSQCSKSFHTSTLLREHENKHLKKFKCPQCDYRANYRSRLNEHILYRHSEQYDYCCQFCQQYFKSRRFLQRHIESHKSEKKNECQICQQKFTSFYSLKRHFRLKHMDEKIIFQCHLCDKNYNRGNNLSRHLIGKHKLRVQNGYTGFVYVKHQHNHQQQQQQQLNKIDTNMIDMAKEQLTNMDIYYINPLSCTDQ